MSSVSLGIVLLALQVSTGTNVPGATTNSPVTSGGGSVTVVNGGDRGQADRDARNFAAFRAAHPEMSYEEAFYSFSWGGADLP